MGGCNANIVSWLNILSWPFVSHLPTYPDVFVRLAPVASSSMHLRRLLESLLQCAVLGTGAFVRTSQPFSCIRTLWISSSEQFSLASTAFDRLGTRSRPVAVWTLSMLAWRPSLFMMDYWSNCWPWKTYPISWVPIWMFYVIRPRSGMIWSRSAILTRKIRFPYTFNNPPIAVS